MAAQRRDGLRLHTGASADTVAQVLGAELDGFSHALQPIIGARGVAALVARCLHLSAARHPWLVPACSDIGTAPDLAWLLGLVQQQSEAEALAASRHCLQGLQELLVSLIGQPLTTQLLPHLQTYAVADRPGENAKP